MEQHKIIVCSLPDYEDLVAEIYIADTFVGLVSQESARGIYIFEPSEGFARQKLPLNTLNEALQAARAALQKVG